MAAKQRPQEAAARDAERQQEEKQRTTAVEQRVDDSIDDEPAGEYRKQLAAEHQAIREKSARTLAARNRQLKEKLGRVSSRVHEAAAARKGSPPPSSNRPSSTRKQLGGLEESTARAGATTDAEEVGAAIELESFHNQVREIVGELRPIEAEILMKRFGLQGSEELTLKEIGGHYSLSRERIRQLQEQALGKIRRELKRRDAF